MAVQESSVAYCNFTEVVKLFNVPGVTAQPERNVLDGTFSLIDRDGDRVTIHRGSPFHDV
jgi:hypothetical protein